MKQKRGVVLLVTLFFIITITTLYLENLDDSKKLIDNSQSKYNLNYTLKIVDDLNGIIETLNKKYDLYEEDKLTYFFDMLPSTSIPINFENVLINIEFERIETMCNINDIYNSEQTNKKTCIDIFNSQNINMEEFTQYTKTFYTQLDNNISNNKQKDYIIDMFIENSYYENGEDIKNNITFLKDTNSSSYLKCTYDIDINNKKINTIEAIYKLEENGTKVKDIEISY